MRRFPRFLLAFCVLVLLAFGVLRCTKNGQQAQGDVGTAAFVPLAPGSNKIGYVTVTTVEDPACYNIDLVDISAHTIELAQNLTQTAGVALLNQAYVTAEVQANNGLRATGNITQVSGSALLNTAVVSSSLDARNGLLLGGNLTQTSGSALFDTAAVTKNLTVGGDFTVTGTCNNCGGGSTFTDEIDAQAGVSVTGGVTVSQNLTVTGWAGLGGTYFAVSTTQDITDGDTIWVGPGVTIYPVTASGPYGTLSDTVSISDGFYLGQIILICNVDTEAHTVVLSDNANTKFGAAVGVKSPAEGADGTALLLWWDGSDWRAGQFY